VVPAPNSTQPAINLPATHNLPSNSLPTIGTPVSGVPAGGVIALPNSTNTIPPTGTSQTQATLNQNAPIENVPNQTQASVPALNNQNVTNQAAIQPSQSFPANQTTPQVVTQQAPVAAPVILPETDYYQQGFDLLKQSRHAQAVETFKQQIISYPDGDLVDDAHYWIAESMYVNRSLDISKQYFKAIIDNFSQSPRLPDAMLKTAYIEQEQGNQIEARILLQEIIQYHPRSNAAISAKNRLAELE
jgi:tol-pal system protein YbgF